MAGENTPSAGAPAAPDAVAAPVVAPEPIAAVAAPAPVAEPAAAAPAEVEAAPVAPLVDPAAPVPEPVAEAAPPVDPAAAAEPPAPRTYEEFKLPDGFQAAPEQISAFTSVLDKFFPDQEAAQAAGQELMDLHGASLTAAVEAMNQRQWDAFEETKAGWRKEIDKQFGNRRNTAVDNAKSLKHQTFGADKKAAASFEAFLETTGAGDHPAFVDFMDRQYRKSNERSAPPRPVPPTGQAARPEDRRYGAAPAKR